MLYMERILQCCIRGHKYQSVAVGASNGNGIRLDDCNIMRSMACVLQCGLKLRVSWCCVLMRDTAWCCVMLVDVMLCCRPACWMLR